MHSVRSVLTAFCRLANPRRNPERKKAFLGSTSHLPSMPGILHSAKKHLFAGFPTLVNSQSQHFATRQLFFGIEDKQQAARIPPTNHSEQTPKHCRATCDVRALCRQQTGHQIKQCRRCRENGACRSVRDLSLLWHPPTRCVRTASKADNAQDTNAQTLKPSILHKYHRRHKKCICTRAFSFKSVNCICTNILMYP